MLQLARALTPDGYAVVPRVPTDAMVEASWHATCNQTKRVYMETKLLSVRDSHLVKTRIRWKAMLEAI